MQVWRLAEQQQNLARVPVSIFGSTSKFLEFPLRRNGDFALVSF